MGAVVPLSELINARQVWRGPAAPSPTGEQPTGWVALDTVLPASGWPAASITEILLPADGVGELRLLFPTLARLTQGRRPVIIVAPPYWPCAMGWRQHGIALDQVYHLQANESEVLWATEQCLRAGCCAAVLAWPHHTDDRALRRLQVAADTGRSLGFVFRNARHRSSSSPAPVRLELDHHQGIWIRKCRGGQPPAQAIHAFQ